MSSLLSNVFSGNYDAVNEHMDAFFTARMDKVMSMQGEDLFTLQDLDKPVNDDETLREYLKDGAQEFGLRIDWYNLTEGSLNAYVMEIDKLWEEACK